MANNTELISQCEAKAKQWLSPAFDEETRKEVEAKLRQKTKQNWLKAFIKTLNLVQVVSAV